MIVAFGSTASFSFYPHLASSLVPSTPEVPGEASPPLEGAIELEPSTAAMQSIARIRLVIDEEPIEDGMNRPAERLLTSHVETHGSVGLLDAIRTSDSPARAAAFLRLTGRSGAIATAQQKKLLEWGLASPSVEVRDAAIQAAENWGDHGLVPLLRAHEEKIGWLRDYAGRVARDLEG